MTSKEALDKLYAIASIKTEINDLEKILDEYKIIKNDLELLDLLKNKLVNLDSVLREKTYYGYNYWRRDNNNLHLTEEEFNSIKKWLEEK